MAKHTLDPRQELAQLESHHAALKRRVAEFDRRAFLTPREAREATDLKKQKLATKDAMQVLKSRLSLN